MVRLLVGKTVAVMAQQEGWDMDMMVEEAQIMRADTAVGLYKLAKKVDKKVDKKAEDMREKGTPEESKPAAEEGTERGLEGMERGLEGMEVGKY